VANSCSNPTCSVECRTFSNPGCEFEENKISDVGSVMKEFPPFRLDETNQCLWRSGEDADERIILTPKAFAVLELLIERAGRLVTQEELLEKVWPDIHIQPEVLKSHIAKIRKVLGDDPKRPRFIETAQRRGYRFIAPISEKPLESLRTATRSNGKFVGREDVLNELSEALQRTLWNQRQIVFVTGEAGIGKTALVTYFKGKAAADVPGIQIAWGQCIEGYGGKEAYYPMLEALGELCRSPAGNSIVQLLADQAPTWLAQLPTLTERQRREVLRRQLLGATRERMLREIGEVLETITSRNPLLLIFEDLHWVDNSTIDLISALARRHAPARLMLIGTYRPVDVVISGHPVNALKQDLVVHKLCDEIALEPLGEKQVAAYLAADSSGTDLPSGLAGLVHRHSEGNPLFMVAALDHMIERDTISHEDGKWKLKVPLEKIELDVPETLRQMIEVQVEQLTAQEQRCLEAASITVSAFSACVNALAANLDPEQFEELSAGISRRYRIVRPCGTRQFPDGTFAHMYEFAHVLYREAFYLRQSPGRRAKLHRSIGERLEALFADRLSDMIPRLARHFEEGCDWRRAVKYLRFVAETAGQRYAPEEATRILRHALDLCEKMPEIERAENEAEILEKLAAIYVVSFDDIRAVEIYEALRAKAAYYGLLDVEIRALVGMAYPLSWSNAQRSLEMVERALELNTRQTDPLTRARTRASCLVRRVWVGGWNAQDAEDCKNALEEIRSGGDALLSAWHTLDCNFMDWCSSKYSEAQKSAVESLAILLGQYEDNPYLSFSYWISQFVLPWSLLFLGEWGEALRTTKSSIALGIKNGDHIRVQTSRLDQAWIHLQAMDASGALTICESVLPALGEPARRPWNRFCRILAGSAELAMENYDRALEHFSAVRKDMDLLPVIHDWYWKMLLESAFTEAWLGKGDFGQARVNAERFLEVTQQTSEHTWQALAWDAIARVAMAERDAQRTRDCISSALSAIDGFEVPLAAWRVHATAAKCFGDAGDTVLSRHHFELSCATLLKLADSLGEEESLQKIFLAAPEVERVIAAAAGVDGRARIAPSQERIRGLVSKPWHCP
jgi:DNA-binding winged helix-turn-helix (wHTH) protein/tetratricopeptide (TPR) repeat protein